MDDYELAEYNRLVNEYNRLVEENENLLQEIRYAETNVAILAKNMLTVSANVIPNVKYVSQKITDADADIGTLLSALESVSEQYFRFKELSTASKNLTKYNDEYYTKFQFFNELRRISLGYIIGLDSYIISNESLRKKVEKCYLANTEYWLAYAIMAVMLWASDEKEAANRALKKALMMDSRKSAVFFMLVNLRFGRKGPAGNWYVYYLDRVDVNDLGEDWQKLLQAYLSGALGDDPRLEKTAQEYYKKMFEQTQAISANYPRQVQDRAEQFIASFPQYTSVGFPSLELYCGDHKDIRMTLSNFEKMGAVAKYYDDIINMKGDEAENTNERIENVLYDLINAYDVKEGALIKEIRFNEAVIAAKGDVSAASIRHNEQYKNYNKKLNAGEMLTKWAFSEDYVETDVTVKRFAISQLSDNIIEGFKTYFEKLKASVKSTFDVTIEGCNVKCDIDRYEDAENQVAEYFRKNKFSFALKDKFFLVSIFICFASLLLLAAGGLLFGTTASPVLLTLGVVIGILGGFLVWRRYVDIGKALAETTRLALVKLRNVYDELGVWRNAINSEMTKEQDLYNSVLRFKE